MTRTPGVRDCAPPDRREDPSSPRAPSGAHDIGELHGILKPVYVVALVSSAGGIEATSSVLRGLPTDLPAAILVLQHVRPTHESLLPEILQTHTSLPVVTARDEAPLEPGRVHVAPSGFHTLIAPDGRCSLIVSGDYPPSRPSADLLLATMGMAFGRRAIAVVMSGAGHDAATGATSVHKCGGTVLATDEETSAYFSMPAATIARDHIVDAIIPVPQLAPRLIELVTAPDLRP